MILKNNLLAFDVDEQFMTGLHWAARCGHPALVKLLIEKYRASLVAKDSYGRHPIHLAVQNRNIECIIRLVVEGSKTTIKDSGGRSAKDLAPDNYVRFLLKKLEEIKFIVRARGYKDYSAYKQDFEESVRAILDVQHQYF